MARLIKGALHEQPHQPRYTETWDVTKVTTYLEALGNNDKLQINDLTMKTVMLIALTRSSRSADFANLNLDQRGIDTLFEYTVRYSILGGKSF